MQLYHLVYYSRRVSSDPAQLDAIVKVSEVNNARLGISGALFANEAHFFQLLEGPRDALNDRLRVIMADDRHAYMALTLFEVLSYRLFSDWRMARLDGADSQVARIFRAYAADVTSPDKMAGPVIWQMIDEMSKAVLAGFSADPS